MTAEVPTARAPAAPNRWPAIAGLAFVVFFVAGVVTSAPDVPESDADLEKWVDWVTDSAHGTLALISALLLVIAAVLFVVFVVGVVQQIRSARGTESISAGVVLGLGILAAAAIVAAAIAINTGPVQYLFDDQLADPTDIQVFVQMQSLGYGLLLVGMALPVAALIAITGASLRNVMPRWFTIVSYIAAIIVLAAVIFIPLIAFPLWMIVASIVMLRRA